MAWRYVVLFFSHFEIFFPLQCSITLTLFWDFFYKEYFVVAATKYMCIADLVKSKNEFPQRCNKKAVLFSHSAWFCLFIMIFSLHQNIYVLLLPGNNFQCTYFALQKCNNSKLLGWAKMHEVFKSLLPRYFLKDIYVK